MKGVLLIGICCLTTAVPVELGGQQAQNRPQCSAAGGEVDRLIEGEIDIPHQVARSSLDSVMSELGYVRALGSQSGALFAAVARRGGPLGANAASWWIESPPEYEVSLNLSRKGTKATTTIIRVWVGCDGSQWDLKRRERLATYVAMQIMVGLGGNLERAKSPFHKSDAPNR